MRSPTAWPMPGCHLFLGTARDPWQFSSLLPSSAASPCLRKQLHKDALRGRISESQKSHMWRRSHCGPNSLHRSKFSPRWCRWAIACSVQCLGLWEKKWLIAEGHAVIWEDCQGRESTTLSLIRGELTPYVGQEMQFTARQSESPEWAGSVIWELAAVCFHPWVPNNEFRIRKSTSHGMAQEVFSTCCPLPSGIQEVRAGFVSTWFPWCITTADGKHFPTSSSPSEEWCRISRKLCTFGAFQRTTTAIRASTVWDTKAWWMLPELAGTCWGLSYTSQQNHLATAVLCQAAHADALSQSHSPPMPTICFAHHPGSCHLPVERASGLGTWTVETTGPCPQDDILPPSLLKTLLCPAGCLQGQRKQMALGWGRSLTKITASPCKIFGLFICPWGWGWPDLNGHPWKIILYKSPDSCLLFCKIVHVSD